MSKKKRRWGNGKCNLSPDLHPWEQQPNEPSLWFRRFLIFLDIPTKRTVIEAWRQCKYKQTVKIQERVPPEDRLAPDEIARQIQTVRSYGPGWWDVKTHWRWIERAEAYDRYLETEKLRAQLAEVQEMGRRHARDAQSQMQVVMLPAVVLARMLQDKDKVMDDLEGEGASKLLKQVLKAGHVLPQLMNAERQARGLSTQIHEQRLTGGDGGPIQLEVPIMVYLPDNQREDVKVESEDGSEAPDGK